MTSRDLGQCFVSFFGAAIECDFNREWRKLTEVIGNLFIDQDTVGEERDQETFLFRVRVDFQKIFAGENFAAGEEQPDDTHVGELVENFLVFVFRELAVSRCQIAHGQIVITMLAVERTTPRHFDRYFNRRALVPEMLMQRHAEFAVRDGI